MPEIGSGNSETTEVEVRLQSETIAQSLLSKLNETGDVVFSSKPSVLDRPQPLTPPRSGEGASGAGPETLPSQLGGQDRTHTAQLSFFFGKEGDLFGWRLYKTELLRRLGIEPFGSSFDVSGSITEVCDRFAEGEVVRAAGRITAHRDMGKTHFLDLRDATGKIQLYFNEKDVGAKITEVFNLIDIGDFVGVEGKYFLTKTQERTLKVTALCFVSRSLRPLPDKWHGLRDIEARYRQRYLDLLTNERSLAVFEKRIAIVRETRRFLEERGFLEVETPILQTIAGGAAAEPFRTHHKALGLDLYLRIALELYLKRLLVGGFNKVFEINRNFRNEGISRKHNPEFTMLEAYWAYADWEKMANLVEELICHLAEKIVEGRAPSHRTGESNKHAGHPHTDIFKGLSSAESVEESALSSPQEQSGAGRSLSLQIQHRDPDGKIIRTINLARPWRRARYHDVVREVAGKDWFELASEQRRDRAVNEFKLDILPQLADFEVTQHVFEKLVEEKTIDPLFVTHCPKELVPLAKQNRADNSLVDVFELIINGAEIAPGYSELNDPLEQRQRLLEQAGEEKQKIDEEFLLALEHGMPPAGGIGIGMDRLTMLLTGAESIRDVILFPLLRPKKQ